MPRIIKRVHLRICLDADFQVGVLEKGLVLWESDAAFCDPLRIVGSLCKHRTPACTGYVARHKPGRTCLLPLGGLSMQLTAQRPSVPSET